MIILTGLFISFVTYFYFFRDSFIAELAISFLPYIMVAIFAVILVLIIFLFIRKNKKSKLVPVFTIIFMILLFGIGYLYSSEFFSFYNHSDENIRLAENEGIKVFYANILYTNDDFKSLEQKIEQENPDIVILVEFSDNHEKEMKQFFKEKYPYMNRNSRSIMLAGDVVFSKLAIKNATTTGMKGKGGRKYSYMQIECENTDFECKNNFDLYVVHTAAPVSVENFEMRNKQLEQLGLNFNQNNSENPTIVIGDFNLSPRSYYYKQLIKNWNLDNALSFQLPNRTRSLRQQKIFRSHIDQIFISPKVKISEVNIEDLTGSDHRSFTFRFGL